MTAASIDELRKAFDERDVTTCGKLLAHNKALIDEASSDGQTFVLSALHRESHGQELGLSELFLNRGARVDTHTAAALGDADTVFAHIDEEPVCLHARDVWGMQPLHWAAHCGHEALVRGLVERGADVCSHADSWTPLHLAVELGHSDVARALIDLGADLNARLDDDNDSFTPMEMAKAWKIEGMVELLTPYYA